MELRAIPRCLSLSLMLRRTLGNSHRQHHWH
jgi:hypothetical protein